MRREQRLRNDADFARAREQGRNYSNRYVAMYVLNNGQEQSRIGIAAGKRLGKAHIRNRVKRQLREAVNRRLSTLQSGVDVVLVARAACVGRAFSDISASVDDLLHKGKLLGIMRAPLTSNETPES